MQGGPYNDWYIYIRLSGSPEATPSPPTCSPWLLQMPRSTLRPERNGYFDLWLENYAALEARALRGTSLRLHGKSRSQRRAFSRARA